MDLYELRRELNAGRSVYDLPLRVTFYARVSTDRDEQLHSLQAQIGYYADFIGKNPNWTLVEGYVDEGISGTSVKKRESFLRMIGDARRGLFDFIVTKEISRFSRNTLDSIRYTQELLSCGVGVLFQSDNINTLMPDAELRLTIMSSIAQDEVRKTSERVRFGFQRAIDKGVVLGNSKIWGYRKENGRLVVDETEAELVRKVFEWYAARGMSIRAVCQRLSREGCRNSNGNPFSFSTVRGILANPKYKGYYCGGKSHKYDYRRSQRKRLDPSEWKLYPDGERVPPIVSEELWDRANEILRRRGGGEDREEPPGREQYAYSGKIFCAEHQAPCYRGSYRGKTGEREVWQCREYVRGGKEACNAPILYTYEMDEILRRALERLSPEPAALARELEAVYAGPGKEGGEPGKRERLLRRAEEVRRKKDWLLELSLRGRVSEEEFAARNEGFNRELKELERAVGTMERERAAEGTGTLSGGELEEAVREALAFPGEIGRPLADALLLRAEVAPGGERGEARVRVRFRTGEKAEFVLRRRRGLPSLCTGSYI